MWYDWSNKNVTIRDSRFFENYSINKGWEGIGLMFEANPDAHFVIENCYFGSNGGSELLVAESQIVSITGCTIENGSLEFRDMDNRNGMGVFACRDVEISNNTFVDAEIWALLGAEDWDASTPGNQNIVIDYNEWYGSEPIVLWGDWYGGLEDIRAHVPIMAHDTWQETSVMPGRRVQSATAGIDMPLHTYDLLGRFVSKGRRAGAPHRMPLARGVYVRKRDAGPAKTLHR
ncbi:MAG: hypothetical protein GF418_03065 [Chitinivibrionales bacterium]|nr:hypothetical protein [Chitinivibrionales bacterium]MBD3394583.1 hypothetical protein [Chitinivibrionales bacterium]